MTLRRTDLVVLGVWLALVFLVLRLLLVWRFPPFVDESLYASWALEGYTLPDRRFTSLASAKEPFLPWLGMLGMWLGIEPLTALRIVSLASGALTCVLTAVLAGRLGGPLAAIGAAIVYVLTPFVVVHDSIGIYEPLAMATVTAALYLSIRLAEDLRLDFALLLGLALGVGLLTKQSTAFAILLLPLGLLLVPWTPAGRLRQLGRWAALNGVALLLAAALHSIMRLSEYYDGLAAGRRAIYPVRSLREALSDPLRWTEANWPVYRDALGGYLTLPLVLAAVVGFGLALRERQRLGIVLLVWILVPLGANVLLAEAPYPRYLLLGLPPILAFAGLGLARIVSLLARLPRRRTIAVAAVAALAFLPAVAFDLRIVSDPGGVEYPSLDDEQFVRGWAAGTGWEELAADLEARMVGKPATVALGEGFSPWIRLRFRDSPVELIRVDAEGATDATFAVENGQALPDLAAAPLRMSRVATYPRPRGGTPLVLYQRVAVINGQTYSSPDELRSRMPDFAFDELVDANPALRRWVDVWAGTASSS